MAVCVKSASRCPGGRPPATPAGGGCANAGRPCGDRAVSGGGISQGTRCANAGQAPRLLDAKAAMEYREARGGRETAPRSPAGGATLQARIEGRSGPRRQLRGWRMNTSRGRVAKAKLSRRRRGHPTRPVQAEGEALQARRPSIGRCCSACRMSPISWGGDGHLQQRVGAG